MECRVLGAERQACRDSGWHIPPPFVLTQPIAVGLIWSSMRLRAWARGSVAT